MLKHLEKAQTNTFQKRKNQKNFQPKKQKSKLGADSNRLGKISSKKMYRNSMENTSYATDTKPTRNPIQSAAKPRQMQRLLHRYSVCFQIKPRQSGSLAAAKFGKVALFSTLQVNIHTYICTCKHIAYAHKSINIYIQVNTYETMCDTCLKSYKIIHSN